MPSPPSTSSKALVLLLAVLLLTSTLAAPATTHTSSANAHSCSADGVAISNGACTTADATDASPSGPWFSSIPTIAYEGPTSINPLAFKYYNASEVIMGKTMKDWLRFSLSFWHTMRGDGSDPFGGPTKAWPWENPALDEMAMAHRRLDVFFELLQKLGVEFWCFHDRDVGPELATLQESNAALDVLAEHAARLQKDQGVKLLWGTAQLFKHRRYMHGAATSPNATVFAWAAAQAKHAMEITHRLGGTAFTFWGGREGYNSLLNTDLAFEQANVARFLKFAARHAKKIGFKGPLMLEPKPQEPTKHQYDFDAATTHAFLLRHNLLKEGNFGLNIECNHATLSGHSCFHELTYSSEAGLLASIDVNSGDPQVGWDTDEFLTDPREATLVALALLRQGGVPVGLNFDAKLRRESTDVEDLVIAHISGMDSLARGLRNAAALILDGRLDSLRTSRYDSYRTTKLGRDIIDEMVGFDELAKYVNEEMSSASDDPGEKMPSGKQELFEMIFNSYVR